MKPTDQTVRRWPPAFLLVVCLTTMARLATGNEPVPAHTPPARAEPAPASGTTNAPAAPVGPEHAPEHADGPSLISATNAPATPAAPSSDSSSNHINAALLDSSEMIVSSNLHKPAHGLSLAERVRQFQIRLDLGRRQRVEKDFAGAVKNFLWIIDDGAPEEMQRTALLELALVAQQQSDLPKAQQMFNQYVNRFPKDASVPEILLRQGLLYRQMGAPTLALSKFYAVMSSAIALKVDGLEAYQRLVLQAQTEIADTYYLQAKFEDAADYFRRLLRLDSPELDKARIQFKLIQSYVHLGRHTEAIGQAQDFVQRFAGSGDEPEVRFLLAMALKQLGRNNDALQQTVLLLQSQQGAGSPEKWNYWKRRTGNAIANQLYNEGDFMHALEIYMDLAQLNETPSWQVPIWYQIGLVYERLQQPQKASETYVRILARENELATNASPGLKAVLDMAKWRKEFVAWRGQAESAARGVAASPTPDSK